MAKIIVPAAKIITGACQFAVENSFAFSLTLCCLLYTSDAADERSSVDLGGRRIIKKKKNTTLIDRRMQTII